MRSSCPSPPRLRACSDNNMAPWRVGGRAGGVFWSNGPYDVTVVHGELANMVSPLTFVALARTPPAHSQKINRWPAGTIKMQFRKLNSILCEPPAVPHMTAPGGHLEKN